MSEPPVAAVGLTKRTFTMEVTRALISHGKRKDCRECPVAASFLPHFPEGVAIGKGTVYFLGRARLTVGYATLPEEAIDFINKFDDFQEVQPFTFSLEVMA